jgi:hypothetical protein
MFKKINIDGIVDVLEKKHNFLKRYFLTYYKIKDL